MSTVLDFRFNLFYPPPKTRKAKGGPMATFRPCPDCAKNGIQAPIVPRRLNEQTALWKCITKDCIYPMSQSLEFFKSQFVPISSIDEHFFRRYIHYDVRSEPCDSETSSARSPQYSPTSSEIIPKPVAAEVTSLHTPTSNDVPVLEVAMQSTSKARVSPGRSIPTLSPVVVGVEYSSSQASTPALPAATVATTVAAPSTEKVVAKPQSAIVYKDKGDELFDPAYVTDKRPPCRPTVSREMPPSFLKHLARKRPAAALEQQLPQQNAESTRVAPPLKKERPLPQLDKVYMRVTSRSLLNNPDPSTDTMFDGYKPNVATSGQNGTGFTPSSSPNFYNYSRHSPGGVSQRSDDASSSNTSRGTKNSKGRSTFSALKNVMVSNIAASKTPQVSPGQQGKSAVPIPANNAQQQRIYHPSPVTGVMAICEFDMSHDPLAPPSLPLGQQVTPPMYPLQQQCQAADLQPVLMSQCASSSINFNSVDDYFDYVPRFDSSNSLAGAAASENQQQDLNGLFDDSSSEQPIFFVDVDEPGDKPIVYHQL